jgi:predicted amidophosphoribosyltransferase
LIAILIWASARRGNSSAPVPAPVVERTATARTCSHCGAALQTDWSNCPQCGAPV